MKISACIVLYNTKPDMLLRAAKSILHSDFIADIKLYLIDNSPTNKLSNVLLDSRVIYIWNSANLGFGSAHNIAINKAIENKSDYHFVINPDIFTDSDVLSPMVEYMENSAFVGMMMPQILNINGSIQYLPKLLPSPYSIIMRKIKFPSFIYDHFINEYELRNVSAELVYNAPVISGCFTLFRVSALKEIGGYDDNFFMYFEDWDLSRRMYYKYKTIYFPNVSVYHEYESGANKSSRLFKIFIKSAIYYFNKWGWFFDKERKRINMKTLSQFSRK